MITNFTQKLLGRINLAAPSATEKAWETSLATTMIQSNQNSKKWHMILQVPGGPGPIQSLICLIRGTASTMQIATPPLLEKIQAKVYCISFIWTNLQAAIEPNVEFFCSIRFVRALSIWENTSSLESFPLTCNKQWPSNLDFGKARHPREREHTDSNNH